MPRPVRSPTPPDRGGPTPGGGGSATAADRQDTLTVTVKDGYGGTTAISVTVDIAPVTRTATTVGTITVNGVAHDAYFSADGTRAVVVTKAAAGGVVAFSVVNTVTGAKVGNFITLSGTAPSFVAFSADGTRASSPPATTTPRTCGSRSSTSRPVPRSAPPTPPRTTWGGQGGRPGSPDECRR